MGEYSLVHLTHSILAVMTILAQSHWRRRGEDVDLTKKMVKTQSKHRRRAEQIKLHKQHRPSATGDEQMVTTASVVLTSSVTDLLRFTSGSTLNDGTQVLPGSQAESAFLQPPRWRQRTETEKNVSTKMGMFLGPEPSLTLTAAQKTLSSYRVGLIPSRREV